MEIIKKCKKGGFVVVEGASPSEMHFDRKTGMIRILIKRDAPEVRVVAATPVIMPRRVRRDIKKGETEKSDEKKTAKLTACGV